MDKRIKEREQKELIANQLTYKEVTKDEAENIINTRTPLGRFYEIDGEVL